MRIGTMPGNDWLVSPVAARAEAQVSEDGLCLTLTNGLLSRVFRLALDFATIDLRNHCTGETLLRGVKPEAVCTIAGVPYPIGGLLGQPDYGYLDPAWLETMTADPRAFHFSTYTIGPTRERFPWHRRRAGADDAPWPPPGIELAIAFTPPAGLEGAALTVHYELYDGMPLLAKWVSLRNDTGHPLPLDTLTTELLAAVEAESNVESTDNRHMPLIHVESDYAFHGFDHISANQTVHWETDPQYDTQVNYACQAPVLLTSTYPVGIGIELAPGETFTSFRTYELLLDSWDRERQGLAVRRMYRLLAPWIQENPCYFHLVGSSSAAIRHAVDQCAEVGFDMMLVSFGAGDDGARDEGAFSMQNTNPAFLDRVRADIAYAHERGIEVGAYTLTSSFDAGPEHNVVHPVTGRTDGAIFGQAPCLASAWADRYYANITHFLDYTGLDCIEDDGSYPGDQCASTSHAHHRGVADSQYRQWERITGFYRRCRERGIYLNAPDWYLFQGMNKTGMGYRETNFSLPRQRQILHARQNIYDGTWQRPPSVGWMFVPFSAYHSPSTEAIFEPLCEHLDELEWHLAQNFGSGVMAAYRGHELYDTAETRDLLRKWIAFYRRYRDILTSDIIHIRRPDGRDLDAMLHVNPRLRHRGLAMIFNPTAHAITDTLTLPLYYAGLTDAVLVREQDGDPARFPLARDYTLALQVNLPPRSFTWHVMEAPESMMPA